MASGEIARDLGYPLSQTNKILRRMLAEGYLALDPAVRTYQPAVRGPLLSYWLHILAALRPKE